MKRRRHTHRRGRTRQDRLALVDELFQRELVTWEVPRDDSESLIVDIGFGDSIATTLRWGRALHAARPRLRCWGVEVDEERIEGARSELASVLLEERRGLRVEVGRGGLHFESEPDEQVPPSASFFCDLGDTPCDAAASFQAIRCCNVLRGYGKQAALAARAALLGRLAPGGVLLEGTTDVEGHLAALDWWSQRAEGLRFEGLILATDFTRGFAPLMFRDVLPRYLRRDCRPGSPVFEQLAAWQTRVGELRPGSPDLARLFSSSLAAGGAELRALWCSPQSAAALLVFEQELEQAPSLGPIES